MTVSLGRYILLIYWQIDRERFQRWFFTPVFPYRRSRAFHTGQEEVRGVHKQWSKVHRLNVTDIIWGMLVCLFVRDFMLLLLSTHTHISNVIDIVIVVVDDWFKIRALSYSGKPLSKIELYKKWYLFLPDILNSSYPCPAFNSALCNLMPVISEFNGSKTGNIFYLIFIGSTVGLTWKQSRRRKAACETGFGDIKEITEIPLT